MSPKSLFHQLPKAIKVKIIKGKSGCFIAELPEYDISTEADSELGLQYNINDLIYTFFDVPKKYRGKIWYQPSQRNKTSFSGIKVPLPFNKFFASDLFKSYRSE